MFAAIRLILEAFDSGKLTTYGLILALEDYETYRGDGRVAIETGELFQNPIASDR